MHAAFLFFIFASSLLSNADPINASPWLTSYSQAWKKGQAEQKRLAVFVGNGPTGWEGVTKEGKLGVKSVALLDATYVRLYVDAQTETGKELATSTFKVPDGLGLVIIDPQVGHVLFRQSGTITDADLQNQLAKLTEPKAAVRTVNYRSATTPASPAKKAQAAAPAKPAAAPKKNC